jgi:DNA-binding Lrp family transcriptional regulator
MFVAAQTIGPGKGILDPKPPPISAIVIRSVQMHAVRQPQTLVQNEMKASPDMRATTAKLTLVERPAPAPLDRKPALSMASIERVRSTSATLRRIENMQKLIGELSLHEMLADEIAWFLKFSPSGARKYIRDLREAGVIELARYVEGTATYLGKAVYQLTPDPERVAAFLAAIVQPKREGAPPRKERPGIREQAMAGSGRHFHILADDTHYAIRVNRGPVMRDPLVAALFGTAPSQQKAE